ncbi:uncharacterized protein G2W53_036017 [Senna tora]|uniref:Uncharacterized protein n=1 Tax=Senna tora TaxID=362788 RepID=A0A834SSR3_9FABA|nr:uncharacterized protein G2W53_036017 [Senna tora]
MLGTKASSKSLENVAFCAGPSLFPDLLERPPAIVVTPSEDPKTLKDCPLLANNTCIIRVNATAVQHISILPFPSKLLGLSNPAEPTSPSEYPEDPPPENLLTALSANRQRKLAIQERKRWKL